MNPDIKKGVYDSLDKDLFGGRKKPEFKPLT